MRVSNEWKTNFKFSWEVRFMTEKQVRKTVLPNLPPFSLFPPLVFA